MRVYYKDKNGVPQQKDAPKGGLKRRSKGNSVQLPSVNATAEERLLFGTELTGKDYLDMGWVTIDLVIQNKTDAVIEISDGQQFPLSERTAMLRAVQRTMVDAQIYDGSTEMALGKELGFISSNSSSEWNMEAPNVKKQHHHKQNIDIINLSEQYILGQIMVDGSKFHSNDSHQSATWNTTSSSASDRHLGQNSERKNFSKTANPNPVNDRFIPLEQLIDGQSQCDEKNPCIDGSCCNKEGKCGYKPAHCVPENCISNCDARAMCGIDSVDGSTP